jgi:MFS family permease
MALPSPVLRRLPALQSPDYRRLFLSTFFTAAARFAMMLARAWLVFELTGSSFAVGFVTFAGMAQNLLVGPVAGAFADRFDRRRLAIAGGVLSMFSSGALAALTLGGVVEVSHVVALAVVQGMAGAVSQPSQRALLANLVPREHLLNAVALGGIAQHGSRLAGPLFGGALLYFLGAGYVFLLSAFVQVFALFLLWRVEYRSPRVEAQAGERVGARMIARDVGRGFAYVGHDRRLLLVIGLLGPHCALTMAFTALMPKLAIDLGGDDRTFSAIVMGVGVGAIVGTLLLSMVRQRLVQGYTLALTGVGSGLAMVAMGMASTPAVAVLAAMLAGGAQATYMAISQTLVQQVVPDELRGRVLSIYVMLAAGHMALVSVGFGWLADSVGVRPLLVIPGLLWIGVFFVAALVLSELRHVLMSGDFRPRAAAAEVAGDL